MHFFLNTQKVLRTAVKAVLEPWVVCEFRSCILISILPAAIHMNVIEFGLKLLKLQASSITSPRPCAGRQR